MNARQHFKEIIDIISSVKVEALSQMGIGKPKEDWKAEMESINALRQ